MAEASEPRITWQTEEYQYREKGADWYWALGIIALVGAILSVIYHDVLFAVIIVFGGLMLGYYARRAPEIVEIAISDNGIRIKDYFYPFKKLKGFNIDEHHMGSFLLIESSRPLIPVVSIPLPKEGMDYEALRALRATKLPEKKITEPESHRIMEHIGY